MAGDWIKMRLSLQTHPKIVRILSATKSDKFRAIGGLHAVWSVFDTHSVDGRLDGYTAETLDHIIGWPGFADALISVGWLAQDGDDALLLPEFDEHNGASGKRRAEDQKRKRDSRKNPEGSGQIADKLRTREEKRREEEDLGFSTPKSVALGSRLPEDWKPSPEDIAYCKSERPDLLPSKVAQNFYDYWIAKPGKDGRKANWSAAWRSWVRKEDTKSAGRPVVVQKKQDWE